MIAIRLKKNVWVYIKRREMRDKKSEKPVFDINDRGYNVKAYYLKDTEIEKGDALIEIRKEDKILKQFIFPAYKIWNIAAHFNDIVDSEIAENIDGYKMAASTGLGSVGFELLKGEK